LGSHNEGHLSLILLWPKTRGELPLSVAQRTPGEDEEAGELFVEVGAIHQRHPESILSEKKLLDSHLLTKLARRRNMTILHGAIPAYDCDQSLSSALDLANL